MKQTVCKWEKAIRVCVLFQDESVYHQSCYSGAQACSLGSEMRSGKKLKNSHPDAAETCQDLAQMTRSKACFFPRIALSLHPPSAALAHFASFPSLVSLSQVISLTLLHCFVSLFIALFTLCVRVSLFLPRISLAVSHFAHIYAWV